MWCHFLVDRYSDPIVSTCRNLVVGFAQAFAKSVLDAQKKLIKKKIKRTPKELFKLIDKERMVKEVGELALKELIELFEELVAVAMAETSGSESPFGWSLSFPENSPVSLLTCRSILKYERAITGRAIQALQEAPQELALKTFVVAYCDEVIKRADEFTEKSGEPNDQSPKKQKEIQAKFHEAGCRAGTFAVAKEATDFDDKEYVQGLGEKHASTMYNKIFSSELLVILKKSAVRKYVRTKIDAHVGEFTGGMGSDTAGALHDAGVVAVEAYVEQGTKPTPVRLTVCFDVHTFCSNQHRNCCTVFMCFRRNSGRRSMGNR